MCVRYAGRARTGLLKITKVAPKAQGWSECVGWGTPCRCTFPLCSLAEALPNPTDTRRHSTQATTLGVRWPFPPAKGTG